ncbi:MAG: methionyl-tRNA formyltransferase [Acidiferrobacterales bacterium]|nr:methionyl-tRNA formyltransferase [Acidiferrobacterales bacterium]
MRVVFAGTPVFSLSSLEALIAHPAANVVAAYTQPDRPAGRGKKLTPSPVKTRALELGINVLQPDSFRDEGTVEAFRALQPDLMVVTAYGLILPQNVLDTPSLGCINVHASLLPRWRGAAPIQRAIEAGDRESGVTLMQMEAGLDTGPMLARQSVEITPEETGGTLHDKLAVLGGRLLSDALDSIAAKTLIAEQQNEDEASYADKLVKSEARIDWSEPAIVIERKVRAFNPWPMANTLLGDQVLRVLTARNVGQHHENPPGSIVQVNANSLVVATAEGGLEISRVQKAGSRPMAVKDYLNGAKLTVGDRFG